MNETKIEKLALAKLQNPEFGQLLVRFFEDYEKLGKPSDKDEHLKKALDMLKTDVEKYNLALKQVKANEESEKILAADKERLAYMQMLKNAVKAFRIAPIEAEREAYHSLILLMNTYKDLKKETYESKTNTINTLVVRLKTDYHAQMDTLELSKFTDRLEKSNKDFNTLFSGRSSVILQKTPSNTGEIRKKLTEDYQNFCNYVQAMAVMGVDAYYKEVLAVINHGRAYFSNVIVSRRGKGKRRKKRSIRTIIR